MLSLSSHRQRELLLLLWLAPQKLEVLQDFVYPTTGNSTWRPSLRRRRVINGGHWRRSLLQPVQYGSYRYC